MTASILLFEDDPDIHRLVMDVLSETGYEVYPARSLAHAARMGATMRFDLFLADSGAPTKELALQRLRQWCEHTGGVVPVIAFTAHNIDRDEARAVGCADAIPKPFDVDELLSRVEAFLSARSATDAGTGGASRQAPHRLLDHGQYTGTNIPPGEGGTGKPSSPYCPVPDRAMVARGET